MWAHTEQQSQAGFSSPCISQQKEIQRQVCLRQTCQTLHKKNSKANGFEAKGKSNWTPLSRQPSIFIWKWCFSGRCFWPKRSKVISLFLSYLVINISEYHSAFLTSLLISGELFFMISPPSSPGWQLTWPLGYIIMHLSSCGLEQRFIYERRGFRVTFMNPPQ